MLKLKKRLFELFLFNYSFILVVKNNVYLSIRFFSTKNELKLKLWLSIIDILSF